MMIETFGIPDYAPAEFESTEEIRSEVGAELRAAVGERFECGWLMWDFQVDDRVAEGPIILTIGRRQIEICFGHREEVYVTFDEINRSRPLAWFGDDNRAYQWLQNPLPEFSSCLHRRVERVGIGERAWTTGGILTYRPTSIEFELDGAFVAVEQQDEANALRFGPVEDTGYRIQWL